MNLETIADAVNLTDDELTEVEFGVVQLVGRIVLLGLVSSLLLSPVPGHTVPDDFEGDRSDETIAREYPEDYPEIRDVESEDRPRYHVTDSDTTKDVYGVPVHDNPTFITVASDRLEYRSAGDAHDVYLWDLQMSIGQDFQQLQLETEGEWEVGGDNPESASVELLYAKALSPFWDLRYGLRQDIDPDPGRTYGVIGLNGLASQWIETDANLNFGEEGDVRVGFEAEYEVFLSQRLIVQPRLETEVLFDEQPEYGLGDGFTGAELGVRLRYELYRKFAPYVGLSRESSLGETANIVEQGGGDTSETVLVTGLKFWF